MKQHSSIWRQIRSNNCFSYSPGANAPWFDIIIPDDSYHVEDINEFIHRQMSKNGHYDKANNKDKIEISAKTNTFKSEIIINNNCDVDLRRYNFINSLLGFDNKLYTSGFNESEIRLIFLLSTAYLSILILFQVFMSMVPHNRNLLILSRSLSRV